MMSHAIGTLKQYKKKQINRIKTEHFEYELITDSFKETQTQKTQQTQNSAVNFFLMKLRNCKFQTKNYVYLLAYFS